MSAGLPLLRVVSNRELAEAEREQAASSMEERQNDEVMLELTSHLRKCWDAAKRAKSEIEDIMLNAMRQRNGEYDPAKLNAIREAGGSEVFMMITEVKCRAAESWLRDILLDTGTPPWDIQPTPIPDLSPEHDQMLQGVLQQLVLKVLQRDGRAMPPDEIEESKELILQQFRLKLLQEASNRSAKMKHKISDQFAQGGWTEAFNDFITDLVTFPVAILKGPVIRRQRALGWEQDENGKTQAVPVDRIAPEYERVDPFKFYPEPGITTIEEGYCFEHHPLTRTMLSELIGVPNYDDEVIRDLLDRGASADSWLTETVEPQKEEEERKFHTEDRPTDIYDALEFWGKVSGKMLIEWGMDEEAVEDPAREYDANVWVIGNRVIKAVLNFDPLGEKPYSKTSFIKCPGAFWGKGIPEIIEDLQSICNASARALVNNMGIASGPQVEVNIDRIPTNEDLTRVFPWKIWQVNNDPTGSSGRAVNFDQPDSNANELMAVYDKFSRLSDEHSGIPAYLYGDLNVQGAGRTSSGLSMLMGSAGKAIRQVVMHIDADLIKPAVSRQYIYNMRYDEDESIKGDADIMPRGAINLAMKETMNVRRLEFLGATQNPVDMEIMGIEGRAAILREVSKGLQMPTDEIIPSRENLNHRLANQPPAPPGGQPGAPNAPSPQALLPDGSPKGGQQANTVSNSDTGGA